MRVPLRERSYDVTFAPDYQGLAAAIAALDPTRVVVLADEHAPLPDLDANVLVLPSGEASKSWDHAGRVLDRILRVPLDRRSVLVGVGGGVVGDLTGFCAAVALRGIPWVMVPTTLLAMVDSAVGGKTAVNHPAGKNLIGAFHQPSAVWAAAHTLETLPAAELRSGMGEVIKTALLAGEALVSDLARHTPFDLAQRCAAFKANIVAEDERDTGRRAHLNLGHTLGHAYEQVTGFALRHGEAVGLGLVAEARAAVSLGIAPPELPGRIAGLLTAAGLPVEPPVLPEEALRAALALDKKASGDILVLPLLRAVGEVTLVRISPAELVERAKAKP